MTARKNIKQKMLLVSSSTLISRVLGVIRELLWSRYLGAGILSDAFFTAYKIPNSLRKIFAEGALSAAFIPTIVQTVRMRGRNAVGELMAVAFLIFEGSVLLACGLAIYNAQSIIRIIAGGFTEEQVLIAAPWLQILMPFIFFISSSALLAGALQSVNHFFVPAFSPVLLNVLFIAGTCFCMAFNLPIAYLCWFMLAGGVLQLLWHMLAYIRLQFTFGPIDRESFTKFKPILVKFALCLPATGAEELKLFISTSFASYLKSGSISLINYASRFAQLPEGVFGSAISTILLPHFSKISSYAPKRLNFYLLESTKLIIWLMLPVTIFMNLFASKIFITIFLSDKFTLAQAYEAGIILKIYLTCLIFISLNRIMRIIFYSQHNTWIPTIVSIISVAINYAANTYLITQFQAPGLALATFFSTLVQSILFVIFLKTQFNIKLYFKPLMHFLAHYFLQLSLQFMLFGIAYYGICTALSYQSQHIIHLFFNTVIFWLWTGPLCLLFAVGIFKLRHRFNIYLHFID